LRRKKRGIGPKNQLKGATGKKRSKYKIGGARSPHRGGSFYSNTKGGKKKAMVLAGNPPFLCVKGEIKEGGPKARVVR